MHACFVVISKEAVETLKLKAQDDSCQLIEIPSPAKDLLIFKVVRLGP